MEVYHGTSKSFEVFDKSKIGSNTKNNGIYGKGFYFAENEALGSLYNWEANLEDNYSPMSVYLNIENPFYWNGNVLEMKVPARDIQWARDDLNEFGYFPQNNGIETNNNLENKDNIVYNEDGIYIEDKKEYARAISSINNDIVKNGNVIGNSFAYTSDYFYAYENNGFENNPTIKMKIGIEGNENLISAVEGEIRNGTYNNTKTIDSIIEEIYRRRNIDNRDNANVEKRTTARENDRLYNRK